MMPNTVMPKAIILSLATPYVVMLNVVMPYAIMLIVVMLRVVAPFECHLLSVIVTF
jgi:hypothetical protein